MAIKWSVVKNENIVLTDIKQSILAAVTAARKAVRKEKLKNVSVLYTRGDVLVREDTSKDGNRWTKKMYEVIKPKVKRSSASSADANPFPFRTKNGAALAKLGNVRHVEKITYMQCHIKGIGVQWVREDNIQKSAS